MQNILFPLWNINNRWFWFQNRIRQQLLCSSQILPFHPVTSRFRLYDIFSVNSHRFLPAASLFLFLFGVLKAKRQVCEVYPAAKKPARRLLTAPLPSCSDKQTFPPSFPVVFICQDPADRCGNQKLIQQQRAASISMWLNTESAPGRAVRRADLHL